MRRYDLRHLIAALVASTSAAMALAEAPVLVQYNERPPFIKKDADGTISGITATPALNAFIKAGVPYELREASPARQLAVLKSNRTPACSIGWYKTAEREKFVKYSREISRDTPMIGLAGPNVPIAAGATLESVLGNSALTVLLKESIVYGPYLETRLASMQAKKATTGAEFVQLVKMIINGRADLTFLPVEEARHYAKAAGFSPHQFRIIEFPGMPAGERRYIMCSQQVSDAVMEKINAAIHQ